MRLVELSQPGCHCGHCRHLTAAPPSEDAGSCIITLAITGHERHERRFWAPAGHFFRQGATGAVSIRSGPRKTTNDHR